MSRFGDRKTAAAKLGVSRQRLEKLIAQGRIQETKDGIDLAKAKKDYEASIDPSKRAAYLARDGSKPKPLTLAVNNDAAPEADPEAGARNFNTSRAEREHWNAEKAKLDYQQRAGELIPREEVVAKEFAVARKLRDRILGFPAKVTSFLPPDAMKMITDECEALVRELQEDAARIAEQRGI